ncbi:MAG TPA: hypothetical protein VNN09_08460 [Candidatus Competibacteraceae bacterium]|nr:hypothetical protein [Candidatus Competibacteraceae bacterium]
MDPQLVYVKTEKGLEEIKSRTRQLSPPLRRILILVDGRATAAEIIDKLKHFGDIGALLAQLEEQGFIAPQGGAASAAAASGASDVSLDETKRRLRDRIYAALGPMADPLVLKLEKCAALDGLRLHAEHCRLLIQENLGQRKADQFWAEVAPLLAAE